MSISMVDDSEIVFGPKFMVIGVGGGGGNAVQHMVDEGIKNVNISFVCANTDKQDLDKWTVANKIQLGAKSTRGLGAGANPEVGKNAAIEEEEEIRAMLAGVQMVFIAAGMGGGTGTGAAPVIARIAREMEILTVAVVTTPFRLEGNRRMKVARAGIEELSTQVDAIITIPNDKVMEVYGNMAVLDAYARANDVLLFAVQGIVQAVYEVGQVNIDFEDVRTAMGARGHAMMGIGRASGDNRAIQATQKAIRSPLLDGLNMTNVQGVIVNIIASDTVLMSELNDIGELLMPMLAEDAEVFYGITTRDNMGDEMQVTVIATGLTQSVPAPIKAAPIAPSAMDLGARTPVSSPAAATPTPTPNPAPTPTQSVQKNTLQDFLKQRQGQS